MMTVDGRPKREVPGRRSPVAGQIFIFFALLLIFLPVMVYASSGQGTIGERVAAGLRGKGLSPEAVVFLVAMLPIVELRGAVPIGNNLFALPLYKTIFFSIAGNMLPIVLVLLFLERLVVWLSPIPLFGRFFDWLFKRTRKKSDIINRFEFWGLVIFVAIPLPMTGAWTGSIAAVLLGISYGRALLAIFLGVLIAGGIVTSLSLLGFWGLVIAVIGLTAIIIYQLFAGKREFSRVKSRGRW